MNKEQYIGSRTEAELAAMQTVQASEIIAEVNQFDQTAADLITRNLYVLTDRLSASEYVELSSDTKEKIEEVTRFSRLYLPLDANDLLSQPYEDTITAQYRMQVQSPLLQLQRTLHNNELDTSSELKTLIAQNVVATAGTAFAHALMETENIAAIQDTLVYFNGNANAALDRANRIAKESYFSEKSLTL